MRIRFYCLMCIIVPFSAWSASLPSWQDNATKQAIVAFVTSVTDPGKDTYVEEADRIAVFDNDGTLWTEQPAYFQFFYALDRLRQKALENPEILQSPILKAAVEGDMKTVLAGGVPALQEIINQSHANVSVEVFEADVQRWLASAVHPDGRKFYDRVYQPMLELMDYLRDNQFTVYIVSGGGIHFIRAFAEARYGVAPPQVVGSRGNSHYEVIDGKPEIIKTEDTIFVDDGPGKPVGIDTHIGKKPIFAGGNSDGDYQMLEWVTSEKPSFGLIVHHTDADREYAYDREGHIGKLDKGLDDASERGWLVVDMKADWLTVYPEVSP